MPLIHAPFIGYQHCSFPVEEAGHQLHCGKPAVIRIDGDNGAMYVCRVHMNESELYRDMVQFCWSWRIVQPPLR